MDFPQNSRGKKSSHSTCRGFRFKVAALFYSICKIQLCLCDCPWSNVWRYIAYAPALKMFEGFVFVVWFQVDCRGVFRLKEFAHRLKLSWEDVQISEQVGCRVRSVELGWDKLKACRFLCDWWAWPGSFLKVSLPLHIFCGNHLVR